MGSRLMAVVDAQLRGHGLHGRRVAGTAVRPTITVANPTTTIAEVAAGWLLAAGLTVALEAAEYRRF